MNARGSRAIAIGILIGWVLVTSVTKSVGASANPEAEPIVELPKFEVTDSRLLPQPESWRYAEIPGFEILSSISERETKRFVRDFLLLQEVIDAIMPGIKGGQTSVPTALVLCGRGNGFDEFLPVDRADEQFSTNSLFLKSSERTSIVVDFALSELRLDNETTEESDPYRGFYLEYFRSLIRRHIGRPPPWLEEGLVQLFASTEFTKKWITFAQVGDGFGGQKTGDFNQLLSRHYLIPLDQLLSGEPPRTDHAYWSAESYAFVHLCLYGLNLRYQKSFLSFVERISSEPVSEQLFKECFNKTYKQMGLELRNYLDFTAYKATQFTAKKGHELPEPPAVALRTATDAEVGRLKGETMRLAGRSREAHNALIAPYIRGERDPRLLAALGLDEDLAGHPDRALTFLEAATAAKIVRPSAYLELARLRLDQIHKGAPDRRLDSHQRESILAPLLTARAQPGATAAIYVLLAEVWTESAEAPSKDDFTVVLQGVSLFPIDTLLVLRATQLALKHGFPAEGLRLAEHGVKIARNPDARDHFAAVVAALRREATPPAPPSP